eukprot:512718-Amphidinium_carterae.1
MTTFLKQSTAAHGATGTTATPSPSQTGARMRKQYPDGDAPLLKHHGNWNFENGSKTTCY